MEYWESKKASSRWFAFIRAELVKAIKKAEADSRNLGKGIFTSKTLKIKIVKRLSNCNRRMRSLSKKFNILNKKVKTKKGKGKLTVKRKLTVKGRSSFQHIEWVLFRLIIKKIKRIKMRIK
jgi:hypothetical protein